MIRSLTRRIAGRDSAFTRRLLPAMESAAERTKLWLGLAVAMAATGGYRGRKAAATGLASMGVSEPACNAVGKQLYERRRPKEQLIPPRGRARAA
ncbi:hypothetical protein [Streptomyces spiramyceticus]|uniref:hypothetical protein n=1 Tax=Streptomyces spiramyceticus TaxID=299717 RepID=UPI00237A46FF|nr:hypothetical protein [Streptomyces spiramyceticus]